MGREQIAPRIMFPNDVKQNILAKSNGCCCHCGKQLALNEVTVEHFIPISKGGTNIEANLVALCIDCNQYKDNYIMKPRDYYKYLNEKAMSDLIVLYECYNQDKSWLTPKNYIREDAVEIKYPIAMPSMQGHKQKNRGKGKSVNGLYATAVLRKATYDDLNDIFNFISAYHEKYGLEKEYLKSVITKVFNLGAVYMLLKQNELKAVVPVTMDIIDIKGVKGYMPVVKGFPCMCLNRFNISITERVFAYIFGNIAEVNPKGNCMFEIHVPNDDKALYEHFSDRYMISAKDGDWTGFIVDIKTSENGVIAYRNSDDYEREFKATSNFLQKTMKLKELQAQRKEPKKKKYAKYQKNIDRNNDYEEYTECEA